MRIFYLLHQNQPNAAETLTALPSTNHAIVMVGQTSADQVRNYYHVPHSSELQLISVENKKVKYVSGQDDIQKFMKGK